MSNNLIEEHNVKDIDLGLSITFSALSCGLLLQIFQKWRSFLDVCSIISSENVMVYKHFFFLIFVVNILLCLLQDKLFIV